MGVFSRKDALASAQEPHYRDREKLGAQKVHRKKTSVNLWLSCSQGQNLNLYRTCESAALAAGWVF